MIQRLSDNERQVYSYLKQVFPNGATNTEIEEATRVHPHQQVFQITRRLICGKGGSAASRDAMGKGRGYFLHCRMEARKEKAEWFERVETGVERDMT